MKRTTIAAARAGAAVLALGAAMYLAMYQATHGPRRAAARAPAVLVPAAAPTQPGWTARVQPLAGDGVEGSADGAAADSRFSDPFGAAVDAYGNVFVAEGGAGHRIRRIGPDGRVTTFAGGRAGFADGPGTTAAFDTPSGLAIDALGNLYVADTGNNAIRKVAPDGGVSTLAGGGAAGDQDGVGRAARFDGPVGVAVDRAGIVYVADTYNDRIRRIDKDGTVTTVAGKARPGRLDGKGAEAGFDTPSGIAVDGEGVLFVADTGNDALRRIGKDGVVTTLEEPADVALRPLLHRPVALALTHDGYLYFGGGADGCIAQRAPDGQYRVLMDADRPPGTSFGSDGSVRLSAPRGIALRRDGSLVVADGAALRVFALAPPRPGAPAVPPAPALSIGSSTAMPWPVSPQDAPHEVVGVLGEVRGNYAGESRDHFHAGLDVRADVGARVLAILPATVEDPYPNWGFGEVGEGMSIGPLSYIHMRVGRDGAGNALDPRFQLLPGPRGQPERVRVRRGTRFAAGDVLGTINRMAHVHMEVGAGGIPLNPLALPFTGLRDTLPPRVESIALVDAGGRPLPPPPKKGGKGRRLHVPRALGQVGIVAEAYDQMDGNQARRRLGLYRLGYQLLHADGSPADGFAEPRITQTWDRLPRERAAVPLLYADGSGITVYGSSATRFGYAITNTLKGGVAQPGVWDVGALAPGDYVLRIYAADYAGNVARQGRDLAITVD